jgi:tRNA uridine 5-carboxymethylaminomethyl modification enzyme
VGLISDADYEKFSERQRLIREITNFVRTKNFGEAALPKNLYIGNDNSGTKLDILLKRPDFDVDTLIDLVPELQNYPRHIVRRVAIEIKYEGYIAREQRAIKDSQYLDKVLIPRDMNFKAVPGLSFEVSEKLGRFKPETLGQASRISGITPAALQVLQVHLRS